MIEDQSGITPYASYSSAGKNGDLGEPEDSAKVANGKFASR
jgi:hypothetical protein